MIRKALSLAFVIVIASTGCGGSPCAELKKVDCSKATDANECEAWKQQGLKDGSDGGCKASLDTNTVKSAMGK